MHPGHPHPHAGNALCRLDQPAAETVEALVLDCRYDVVLVHPERFCFSKSNRHKLEKLAELPIGLQVNAGSLLRWGTRRLALDLLQMAHIRCWAATATT